MSNLWMVRHGQASVRGDDYDNLSEKGVHQAKALGRAWLAQKIQFDFVFVGPRKRHAQTWQAIQSEFELAGIPLPAAEFLAEWDEHAGQLVMAKALPQLSAEYPELLALISELKKGSVDAEQKFLKLYQDASQRWVKGDLRFDELEDWSRFRERIESALGDLQSRCRSGKKVAVITSGGPVAAAMGNALELSNEKVLELSWIIRNGAVSEFLYSQDRFGVLSFNDTSHLDRESVTFI